MTPGKRQIYVRESELDFTIDSLPVRPVQDAVLLVRPIGFQVEYVINPHMQDHVGSVDTDKAMSQWANLVQTYRSLGLEVHIEDGRAGLPDMVFCANQSLPALDSGGRRVAVLSNMHASERADEVKYFRRFFDQLGYLIYDGVPGDFEGMGDALWHFDRPLLWIGTGFRTTEDAALTISERLGTRTIVLKLKNSRFYHLDTCLSILTADTAMWVPSAFAESSRRVISSLVPNLIEVPIDEARDALACNAHCPDGHHVVIQSGCDQTIKLIRDHGFDVIECETGEFLKSGGSVFCMKQMFWTNRACPA